jgi:hypothetical protein
MAVRKEIEGVLIHKRGELALRTDEGKVKLLYNLFDGFSGKRVIVTVEEVTREEVDEE